jgi:hypothetical protein
MKQRHRCSLSGSVSPCCLYGVDYMLLGHSRMLIIWRVPDGLTYMSILFLKLLKQNVILKTIHSQDRILQSIRYVAFFKYTMFIVAEVCCIFIECLIEYMLAFLISSSFKGFVSKAPFVPYTGH